MPRFSLAVGKTLADVASCVVNGNAGPVDVRALLAAAPGGVVTVPEGSFAEVLRALCLGPVEGAPLPPLIPSRTLIPSASLIPNRARRAVVPPLLREV